MPERRSERRARGPRLLVGVPGSMNPGTRGARPFSVRPEAGHYAAKPRRRVRERRGGGSADPLRDPSEARGLSNPQELTQEALAAIARAINESEVAAIEVDYLRRKNGRISSLLSDIGKLPADERATLGQAANEAKRVIESALAAKRHELEDARLADIAETEAIDITFPGPPLGRGHIHVLTQVQRQTETVLESLGYKVDPGPTSQTDPHNLHALTTP